MGIDENRFTAVAYMGRVTIPKNIRERLGIELSGDEVVLEVIKKVEK